MQHKSSLYRNFSRNDALRLIGGNREPRFVCGGQWAIWPDTVACLAVIGAPPTHSHFDVASSFCWVADQPYRAREDRHVTFIPGEVIGGESDGRPIHLFVRREDLPTFVYLGELEPSAYQRTGATGNYGEAHFKLRPTLPSDIWKQFGFQPPGDIDHAAVDAQLARLAGETTLDERFDMLRTVVEYWHGPIRPQDGYSDAELADIPMPEALRRWFRWAGKRQSIMSGQNELLEPSRLKAEDGRLVFYGENQWCFEWATSVAGDDPPVFGRESEPDSWKPQGLRVSEHLILACLFEAIMCHAKYGASTAWLEESMVDWIRQQTPAVPLSPWTWTGETRFFAGDGRFMFTMPNGKQDGVQGYSVWIGAKTEQPLRFLKDIVDDSWEYASI
jgi:hypothetical protein